MSERIDIRIASGDGELAAWGYHPPGARSEAPCVVLAHGLSGTREDRLGAFAERFAEAGFAALVFDYRHLGDCSGEPRQLVDLQRQYADWDAAIAHASTLDGVHPARIAIWGSSFTGGHIIDAAVRHPQLAAAVVQVPFTDGFFESMRIPLRRRLPLLAAAARDELRARRGRQPYYIPVGGPSGAFAIIAEDDTWAGWRATVGEQSKWRNEIPARLIRLATHRPARHASMVACPLLVQVVECESVVHNAPAVRAAAQAPRGELRRYPTLRHFDSYTGNGFELMVRDQIEFLKRHLSPDPEETT